MKQERRKHELLSNTEQLIQELKLREKIPKEEMVYLLNRVSLLVSTPALQLENQPNLLRLASPINIVGDIHGYSLFH